MTAIREKAGIKAHQEPRANGLERNITSKLMKDLAPEFEMVAERQSRRLVEAHERFSSLMEHRGYQVVYPVLPMDLLGVYVLLPE